MRICLTGPCSPRDVEQLLNRDDAEFALKLKGERGIPVSCLAGVLVELGHHVTVVTSTDEVSNRIEFNGPNFRIIVVPQRLRSRDLAFSLYSKEVKLIQLELESLDVEIINAHWTYEFALAALNCDVNSIITSHDSPWQILKSATHPFWFFRYLLALRVRVKARHLIFVSEDLHQKWKREMKWKKTSWVIPNMQTFKVVEQLHTFKNDSNLRILTIGDPSPRKNIKGAIEAFQLARKEFPRISLHLAGVGLEENSDFYFEMNRVFDLEGITWHGYLERDAMLNLFLNSDILFQPSLIESFGLTLLEAMSMGVTVLAGSNTGAAKEIVGDFGLLVDTRVVEEMASGLIELISDPLNRQSLTVSAKQRVDQLFSSLAVANSTLSCYIHINQLSQKA